MVCIWFVSVSVDEKWNTVANWGLMVISAVLALLLVQSSMGLLFSLHEMTWKRGFLNVGCYAFCIAFTYLITGRIKFSIIFTMVWTMALSTANYFTTLFRGREMTMPDLLSIRTAMNVVDRYTFVPCTLMVLAWLAFVVWTVFLCRDVKLPETKTFKSRISPAIMTVLSLTLIFGLRGAVYSDFVQKPDFGDSRFNGFLVNFIFGNQFIEKPEEYETFDFIEAEQKYNIVNEQMKKPNVIVIMGEAFADMRVFNGELRTTKSVMPYMDALSEDTIKGMALSSIYGGNTCNSEYEFLSGNTLAFLPDGCVPFQQYVVGNTYSLAHYLRSLGYETVATHPNIGAAWARDKVWPELGFENTIFLDQYDRENMSRGYIPDRDVVEKITDTMDNKEPGKPLFMYAVTIKGHGSYGGAGSEQYTTLHLEGYEQDYPDVEEYLSLMNETDAAVQYLLEYLQTYAEDTIVLFYGDHQPAFGSGFQEELYGKSFSSLADQQVLYTVPYFIWANFDIPEEEKELSSLNYLSNYLLEAAGMELPPYGRFLKDVEEVIPAVNALGYYSVQENRFLAIKEAQGQEKQMLSDYSCMQYNAVRGGTKQSKVFFEDFIG